MTYFSRQEFEKIATLYLDGELAQDEAKSFEAYLAENSGSAKELNELKELRRLLQARSPIEENDWFWLKLNNRIEEHERKLTIPIFRRRSTYAFSSLLLLSAFVIGTIYFKNAAVVKSFFLEKKNQVESSILSGNILPFFSNLDKNKVLQFALFGNLSLDSSHTTELQVTNDAGKGSRIEIASLAEPKYLNVSFDNFADEMRMTTTQRNTVDSLLEKCTERLQASVLIDEHRRIAINEELTNLNKMMVSSIAASLEPHQRVKFQRYLAVHNVPFTIASLNAPAALPNKVLQHVASIPQSKKFVVISPDSVSFAELRFNLDSIKKTTKQIVQENQQQRLMALHVMRDVLSKQKMLVEAQSLNETNPVRVTQGNDLFQIHFEQPTELPSIQEFPFDENSSSRIFSRQAPKISRVPNNVFIEDDSSILFELSGDSVVLRTLKSLSQGELQFELFDSLLNSPTMRLRITPNQRKKLELRANEWNSKRSKENLVDLDSLLEEANKQEQIENIKLKSKAMDL